MVPRYLGFIGYCSLLVASLLINTFVSALILLFGVIAVAAAWVILGLDVGDVVMIANGMAMVAGPVLVAALLAKHVESLADLIRFSPIIFATGMICWLLHLLAHFRAWKELGIGLFMYSAVCQIAAMITTFAGVATLPKGFNITANVSAITALKGPALQILALAGLLAMASYILSATAFLSVEKKGIK